MKKIIWTYGLVSGIIVGAMLVLSLPLHEQGVIDFDSGMVVGYTTMVIALSLVFSESETTAIRTVVVVFLSAPE